jgi:alanine dehydrogenase
VIIVRIGVPKEIKAGEYRIGLTPGSVHELIALGHTVYVEHNAGIGIGYDDAAYATAGAEILASAQQVYERAEMIVKVKEPQPSEYVFLRAELILFTYLHLAADLKQTEALVTSKCIAIAYETVTDPWGGLPLLAPMSEVAGRLSVQAGAHCLEKANHGRGILLGGVAGVEAGNVVVIGGGVVGINAIRVALGMEASVVVLDKSLKRLKELDFQFDSKLHTIYATRAAVEEYVLNADLVIGAVLIPGRTAPKLITHAMLPKMRPGSVIVDVAIDQGGCCETSRPTTHAEPTYVVDGVVHYCVANMPGAVPRTATAALNNATLPYIIAIANKGYKQALLEDIYLLNGLNVCNGTITSEAVALDLGKPYIPARDVLSGFNN